MLSIALLFYIFAAAIFLVSSATVLYHFYHFSVGGSHQVLIVIFIVGSLVLFIIGFLSFALIDWEATLEFIKNKNDIISPR